MLWLRYRRQEVWKCFMRCIITCGCVLCVLPNMLGVCRNIYSSHSHILPFPPPAPHTRTRTHTGTAAFIDAEHALDPVYAKNLGVNVDDLLVCQVGSVCYADRGTLMCCDSVPVCA
jgi:recA bacterial DNA recombination protein